MTVHQSHVRTETRPERAAAVRSVSILGATGSVGGSTVDLLKRGAGRYRVEAITANRNAIPFDQNPPFNPSGMRFGSPAVTTRGFREAQMREVAELIAQILDNIQNEDVVNQVRLAVRALTDRFPLYAWKLTPAAYR